MSEPGAGIIRKEIEELHQFFERWMAGEIDDFSRCGTVLAHDFTMVGPNGRLHDLETLVRGLHAQHGKRRVAIRIANLDVRMVGEGFALARYEEWQQDEDALRGRISTALFRPRSDTPNGFEWVAVHETWLPR